MEKFDPYMDCVCRTCLNEDEASSYGNNITLQQQWLTIFDIIDECGALQIAELLSQVVPQMDMQLSDELPKKICGKCMQQLLSAHRFQQMCVRSQEQMRQIVSTKRTDFTTPSIAASKEFACGTNDTDSSVLETSHFSKSFHNFRHASIEERPQEITGQISDPEAVESSSVANINKFPEAYKVEEDFFKKFLRNEPNMDGGDAMHSANSILSVKYEEKQVNVTTDQRIATDTSQSSAVEHVQSIDQSLERCKNSQGELSQLIKNEPIEDDEPSTEYSNGDTIHSTISVMKDELLPIESEEGQANVTSPQHIHANADTRSNSARHLSLKQSLDVPNTEPILKQHACASCDKIFKSAAALKRHGRIHTAEQPECEKSSTSGNVKKRHIRDSEDKPYECPYCPLRFRCKQGVSRHKKIHEDVEREVCDICGKNVRKSTLKSHKVMHTDEKPYTCEFCEKGFIRIQELRLHMYIHTGEKPYKCEYCDRAHASRSTLLHHLMSHLGENVFRCELCPLAFPLASERRLHLLTHKNEDAETREQNMKALREKEAKLRLRISKNETPQTSAENSQQQLEQSHLNRGMVRARKAVVGFIAQLAANNRQLEEVRKRRQLRLRKIMAAIRLRNSLTYFAKNINKPKRIWTHTRHGKFWELDIPCNSDKFFKESFRMTRESFSILCNELKCMAKRDTTYRKCIPLEKRVAIALYTLGSSAEYRTIGRLFGVSKASVCCILKAFCSTVWDKLAPQYLPNIFLTQDKIAECVRGFEKLGFPQCLGALDGCHIEIRPSAADAVDYYNYKGWYSMVLLALVDYRYRFMYINVGAPGRCNDSQIFEQSFLRQILESPLMSENVKVIGGTNVPVVVLGDSAFRLSHFLMKPYPHNSAAEEKEKVFNYHQAKSRRVVENSFGQVKARFRRIGKGIDNDIKNATSIIKCCCVLHNFVNERNDNINSQWIQSQAIFETENNREQPEPTYHPQGHNSNAESIREAIASFLCPS